MEEAAVCSFDGVDVIADLEYCLADIASFVVMACVAGEVLRDAAKCVPNQLNPKVDIKARQPCGQISLTLENV